MKTFFLILGLAGAAGSMCASPVLYNFSFTGGSPNPVGSFVYDSSLSSNPFSNVQISWDGLTFNSTAMTNDINSSTAGDPGFTFGSVLTGRWFASIGPNCPGPAQCAELTVVTSAGDFFTPSGNSFSVLTGDANLSTNGNYTANIATPEPGSLMLVIGGGAWLAWKRRPRRA